MYLLADFIYPDYPIFVKSVKNSNNEKAANLRTVQEAVRKDVERAFGVLVSR